jgi:2-(1,2-epoxy-1,2-dihydrophenyl)acetyl-CoA isomerase
MKFETITLDISDNIATITLNRPERLNACSLDMADDIADALDQLGDARCLIITGAGRAFCSGALASARRTSSHRRAGQLCGTHAALQPNNDEDRPVEHSGHHCRQRPGGGRGLLDRAGG